MSNELLRRVLQNREAAKEGGREARQITVRTFAENPVRAARTTLGAAERAARTAVNVESPAELDYAV